MPRPRSSTPHTVQSVDKASAWLWVLAEIDEDEVGVLDLSRRTGLNPSTVSRLLNSLVAGRLVQHTASTGRYRVGLGEVTLANSAVGRLDMREIAHPHLLVLEERLGETVSLNVYADDAITIDVVPSRHSVLSMTRLGRAALPHCTAVGKMLLAYQPEATIDHVLSGSLARLTPRTVTDLGFLRAELERVRGRAYATAEGEREPDLNAVAVPIYGRRGRVIAALGLQGPAYRLDRAAMEAAVPLLQSEAESIGRELGHPSPPR
ncbi:MAG: IclR family transcriptional regulator [Chloroflexota bacterium]